MYAFFCIFAHMNSDEIMTYSVETLIRGGIILYPTDTIWGIGCDARNREAVERIYAIKERNHNKSMLLLVGSGKWKVGNDKRPTTYILSREQWRPLVGDMVADNLPAADGSLGIRVPNHRFCQELLCRLGAPIVSTSANLSGHPSPQSYAEIEDELKKRVDFCVPPLAEFLSNETRGSRIVKIGADGSQTIIRP
jgi:L-threonylcarbamoyladenylate synthase